MPRIPIDNSPDSTLALALDGYLALKSKSRNTGPNVYPMGAIQKEKYELLEAGAAILQQKSPLEAMSLYLNGFHCNCSANRLQVYEKPCTFT